MGSFQGHALPGSFFIVFGIWWMFNIIKRYFKSFNETTFESGATFPLKKYPVEPGLKLFFVTVGMAIEIFIGESMQHTTMYFFFGLTGVVDLLLYFDFNIPKDLDYVSLSLAIAIEAMLFKYHLFGSSTLEILVHTLLIYVLCCAFISTVLEMRYKNNILVSLLRPYFFILQGTWFYQVGYILYNPFSAPWDPESHHSFMTAALVFTWHCGILFAIMLFVFCLFGKFYSQNRTQNKYRELDIELCETE